MNSVRIPAQARPQVVGLVALAALLVPLIFALFTAHVWEDYYITLRSSRNLVQGAGLVFQPGERLHTFTSPVGVLVPAACLWLAQGSDAGALWLFRAVCALTLASAAGLLWQRTTECGLGPVGKLVLFGLWLADPKLADFASNGMETSLLVALLVLLWSEWERPAGARPRRLALLYAGLMWTRPDAFILAGVLTAAQLFPGRRPASLLATAGRGILWGALLYLPWLLWSWYYFGSFIPHTIVAKATQTPPLLLSNVALVPLRSLVGHSMLEYLFLPANYLFGGWPHELRLGARVLSVIAAFGWLVPGWAAPGRRASLALFAGSFYFCSINLYAWYVPPWTLLAALALAFAADHAHRRLAASARPYWGRVVRLAAMSVVVVQLCLLAAVAWQMRVQQRVIEDGGRREIGEWLRTHAATGDTVFLESLGYIGYFSGMKTYDFPGLSSREVTAAIAGGARRYVDVIQVLEPDWLVLRPVEVAREGLLDSTTLAGYELVKTWDARPALDSIALLPGREWLMYDTVFLVYRKMKP